MVECLNHLDMTLTRHGIFLIEVIQNIAHTQTVTADLVGVSRTDTLARSANLGFPFCRLVGFVQQAVGRQDQVRFLGYIETLRQRVSRLRQFFRLFHKQQRVKHHTIADDVHLAPLEDTRRDTTKHVLLSVELEGMPCIGSSLETGYHIITRRQYIHHLAFALVPPLET